MQSLLQNKKDIFQIIKDIEKPVILFGAGNAGMKVLTLLRQNNIEPVCFCDNDVERQHSFVNNLEILGYDDIEKCFPQRCFILSVTPIYATQILEQLYQRNKNETIIPFTIPFKVDDTLLSLENYNENFIRYQEVLDYFQDDISQKTYCELIDYKLTGNGLKLLPYIDGKSFFDENLLPYSKEHTLVDVGAYTGDTIMQFCQFINGYYTQIIGLELDIKNFENLNAFLQFSRIENVKTLNIGAWNQKGTMKCYSLSGSFENANLFIPISNKLDAAHHKLVKNGDYNCIEYCADVNTIDNILHGQKVTIIKINALASDYEVLQGCQDTIHQHKPILIFDFGSKPEHLLTVPQLIKALNPSYKLYLRQKLIFGDSKSILYAIM